MDGENNGKPNFLMDALGVITTIFGNIHIDTSFNTKKNTFDLDQRTPL